MKQKNVYLTIGIPGAGKSTWIQQMFNKKTDLIVSRDFIRFAILDYYQEVEDYFRYEDEVWVKFINQINEGLKNDSIERIIIDATHLTPLSRKRVLEKLEGDFYLTMLCFNTPLKIALERNAQRSNRANVPEKVIERMSKTLTFPTKAEHKQWKFQEVFIDTTKEVNEYEQNLVNL